MIFKNKIAAYMLVTGLILMSCNTDETQTVATFDNLVFEQEFNTDGVIDRTIWNFDIGDGTEDFLTLEKI